MKPLAFRPPRSIQSVLGGKEPKILDIGCGNNCLDIATHLVDMMPDSNQERAGDLDVPAGKNFHRGSIESLPFEAGYFDFIHAAHILEHVEAPEAALSELMRAGRSGYIETPSAVAEQASYFASGKGGLDFHRWYVWSFPGEAKLYFRRKTPSAHWKFCQCVFGKAIRRLLDDVEFQDIYQHLPYYCVMTHLFWEGKIEHEIWAEEQNGKPARGLPCNCAYAAFFVEVKRYMKSILQIRRRWRFKRMSPKAYQLLTQTVQAL